MKLPVISDILIMKQLVVFSSRFTVIFVRSLRVGDCDPCYKGPYFKISVRSVERMPGEWRVDRLGQQFPYIISHIVVANDCLENYWWLPSSEVAIQRALILMQVTRKLPVLTCIPHCQDTQKHSNDYILENRHVISQLWSRRSSLVSNCAVWCRKTKSIQLFKQRRSFCTN